MTETQRLDPDPLYVEDAGEEPWPVPVERTRSASALRYLLRCAWRSHDNTTADGITRCRRCGKEWTR